MYFSSSCEGYLFHGRLKRSMIESPLPPQDANLSGPNADGKDIQQTPCTNVIQVHQIEHSPGYPVYGAL